jgi:hypothetical protein
LEEGVIAPRARQPLERQELTTGWLSAQPGTDELRDEYRQRGHVVQTPEELAAELKRAGANGLSVALNNGLRKTKIPYWWHPTIRNGSWP